MYVSDKVPHGLRRDDAMHTGSRRAENKTLKNLKPEKLLRQAGRRLGPLSHLRGNYPVPRAPAAQGDLLALMARPNVSRFLIFVPYLIQTYKGVQIPISG
jgi:hypothetical protein